MGVPLTLTQARSASVAEGAVQNEIISVPWSGDNMSNLGSVVDALRTVH